MNDCAQSKKNINTPSAEREDCNRDTGPWRKGERESTCKAMLNVVKGMQRKSEAVVHRGRDFYLFAWLEGRHA